MRTVVQRYLAAHFIVPFVVSLIFFVSFLLTFQMFRIIRFLTDKSINPILILELIGHMAISFLPMAIPLSALFATIYTMNRLSEDSEVVAMRSFGFSKYRLFTPFVILAFLVSITIFTLNQVIIPHSQRDFRNGINRLTSKGLFSEIKPGKFFIDIPGVTLFAERVSSEGKILSDVFIQSRSDDEGRQNTIFAKEGRLIKLNEDKWGRSNIRLHLFDGNIVREEKDSHNVEKILFGEYEFPLLNMDGGENSVMKDSMRTSRELHEIMRLSKDERVRVIGTESLSRIKLEYWSRFNTPLECFLFIVIGFCLGIKPSRGRGKGSGPITLSILVGYYALFFFGLSLAKKGNLAPEIAVFAPSLILAVVAVWLFKKLDWVN